MTEEPGADDVWAIVLAGGSGRRFGGPPKQFERVGGVRMVDRTIATARTVCGKVALVLPAGHQWDGEPVDTLAAGGDHQSDSLRAALATVPAEAEIVVVCDPAHPLASPALFSAVVAAIRAGADGAVPVVPILEVIQRVADGQVVDTLPKGDLVITQAPHAFRAPVLRAVHADRPQPVENSGLLVERGYRVVTVPGDNGNLHVATAGDLALVRALAAVDAPVRAEPDGEPAR